MTLKQCSHCKKMATTKTVKKIGRNQFGLWVNHVCGSTLLIRSDEATELGNEAGPMGVQGIRGPSSGVESIDAIIKAQRK